MKAELLSDYIGDLPNLTVIAETELEWRVLQLYMRLMSQGITRIHASYDSSAGDPPCQ